jgi:hypothetical protein
MLIFKEIIEELNSQNVQSHDEQKTKLDESVNSCVEKAFENYETIKYSL